MWEPEKIKRKAQKDYEETWTETASLAKKTGRKILWKKTTGKPHPVKSLIQKIRKTLLSYGFEELINPSIVPEEDVRRQYGPEAAVILDRIFYLAGLPRPDIGLSQKKTLQIRRIVPDFSADNVKKLQRIFREYKEAKIEGDDLVEHIVNRLRIETAEATAILGLFPELKELTPIPSKLTLRSHMTALWFPVLAALQHKKPLPMKLFSIGTKYRREQKLDETHLYESYVASIAVMAEDITLEDGKELCKAVLSDLGFKNAKFEVKKATSKYYAPKTEIEVFVKADEKWIEIGDIGLYSPVSLAQYNISHPVFNAGFGVERIAMLLQGAKDIRSLTYPQLYAPLELSDSQIAKMVKIEAKPKTKTGKKIAEAITATALKHGEEPSPCEFQAYRGKIAEKQVKVYVYETDVGVKLLGPAARNRIYIYKANILGIPEKGIEHAPIVKESRERGTALGFSYLDAVASLAAAKIEEAVRLGRKTVNIRVKIAKNPSDINIKISEVAHRYITSRKNKIETTGPAFIGIRAEITAD